ncbi:MAG: hypothetical protein IJ757_03295 [Clostridiales bacterium]|nr:hypothetical protein [Clostridiales bacterium]
MDSQQSPRKIPIKEFRYRRHILLGLLFFFFNYTFSSVNNSFIFLIYNHLEADYAILNIRLNLLIFAGALLLYGVWFSVSKLSHNDRARLTGIVTIISTIFILVLFKSDNRVLFLISGYVLQFVIALECVYCYSLMYRAFASVSHMDLVFSLSMTCSFLMQYALQPDLNYNLSLYMLILFSFIAAFINMSGLAEHLVDVEDDERISSASGTKGYAGEYIICLLAIVLLELVGNFLSDSLLSLVSEGNNIVFSTPRLATVPVYLLMGFIAARKDMKYLPTVTLAGVLIGILNPVLFNDSSMLYVNTCIYYVVAGFINSFLVLIMFKYAMGGQKYAPLIAVSGRIIDSIASAVFTSSLIPELPLYSGIAIELACIVLIFLLFTFTGQLNTKDTMKVTMQRISPAEFARIYGFSDKETELFTTSLTFEGNMSELARSLYISRSVLYRTLSNICDKTGCSSFQAVRALYYDYPAAEASSTSELPKEQPTEAKHEQEQEPEEDLTTRIKSFCTKYDLTDKEAATFKAYLSFPDKTQQELADMQGATLRTVQRHLSSIRTKTGTKSLAQLSKLFYEN